jgi:type IV secretion system protein VirB9
MQTPKVISIFLAAVATTSAQQIPPALKSFDYTGQLRELQTDPTKTSSQPIAPVTRPAAQSPRPAPPPPANPKPIQPLNAAAREAVGLSADWKEGAAAPVATDSSGRVLYSFGAGLPTVVCAPLRVCTIELQQGEKVTSEPHLGDTVRWNSALAFYGTGEAETPVVVLKPQASGLDTNLLVTTDRRAYYVRLVSQSSEYIARLAFTYPDDDLKRWKAETDAHYAAVEASAKAKTQPVALLSAEKLHFAYTVKGGSIFTKPLRVFDDSQKTYIQMRPEIQNRELPVLLVLGPDGKGEVTNYRVKDQTFIVDRLFDRAQLVDGVGKKAKKVEIARQGKSAERGNN